MKLLLKLKKSPEKNEKTPRISPNKKTTTKMVVKARRKLNLAAKGMLIQSMARVYYNSVPPTYPCFSFITGFVSIILLLHLPPNLTVSLLSTSALLQRGRLW